MIECEEPISSTKCEIRFRSSEDQIRLDLEKRRKVVSIIGCIGIKCSFCGGYRRVLTNPFEGWCECEDCWLKRRFEQLIKGEE